MAKIARAKPALLLWFYSALLLTDNRLLTHCATLSEGNSWENSIDSFSTDAKAVPERRSCDYERDASGVLELSTPEFIEKHGYPAEVHQVVSADGYVIEVHRIPKSNRPVMILFHGMLMTTREWFLNCEGRSLPMKLTNAGYDVWLVNARGNKYSMRHVRYNETDAKYWSYSVDEIITYDAPAVIDYVRNVTGEARVNWLGWSLGSAVILGLLSSQPEYNEKINIVFTFGTVAYVGHTKAIALKLVSYLNKALDAVFTYFNRGRFLPGFLMAIYYKVAPILCYPEAKLNFRGVCSTALRLIDGYNPGQLNLAYFPLVVSSFPSSGSVKMFNQWFQWIRSDKFSMYDYGILENLRRYRALRPPEYPLNRVTAKCVNLWADNDYISTPRDVEKTIRSLPNVIHNIHINMTQWNHLDFGMARDADIYVYDPIIAILDRYSEQRE